MPTDTVPDVPAPPDATEVSDWSSGDDLALRSFAGTVREAVGFAVRVKGVQRRNGTSIRWVSVDVDSPGAPLAPEAVRQLASALTAAADEIEARR